QKFAMLWLLSLHGKARPPWIGRKPHYLDEYRKFRHRCAAVGTELPEGRLGLEGRGSIRQSVRPQFLRGPHRLPHPLFGPSQGASFQRPSLWLGDRNGLAHLARDYSWR